MKIKYLIVIAYIFLCVQCKVQQKLTDKDLAIYHYNQLKNKNFTDLKEWTIFPREYYPNNYAYFFFLKVENKDNSRFKKHSVLLYDSIKKAPDYRTITCEDKYLSKRFVVRKLKLKDTLFVVDTIYAKPNYNFCSEYFGVESKQQVLDSLINIYHKFKKLNIYGFRLDPPPKNIYHFELSEHIDLIYFTNDFEGIEKYKKELIAIDEKWYYKVNPSWLAFTTRASNSQLSTVFTFKQTHIIPLKINLARVCNACIYI